MYMYILLPNLLGVGENWPLGGGGEGLLYETLVYGLEAMKLRI